ncbi:MAG: polysaccharide deacetylase family protein [Longimicrobiales bacterium]
MNYITKTVGIGVIGLVTASCSPDSGTKASSATDSTIAGNTAQIAAESPAAIAASSASASSASAAPASAEPVSDRGPNELGRIPILEYHLIGDKPGQWTRTPAELAQDLARLYERGYRPVNMTDVLDHKLDLPRGLSPVVFVFDDASPSQFRYIEKNGEIVIDPTSAVGIWNEFQRTHPDWKSRAVFCVLSGAAAGRSFFGDKGIEGQKSEWRFKKLQYLNKQGFEICNHTLWHMTMSKYGDAPVQEQIARLDLAVDSALPGYRIRTLALPLGEWPKNKALAHQGSWTDPKTGRARPYKYDAVLLVAGGAARSPHDPQYDPLRYPREQVFGHALTRLLDHLDAGPTRYVSDGNPKVTAKPAAKLEAKPAQAAAKAKSTQ